MERFHVLNSRIFPLTFQFFVLWFANTNAYLLLVSLSNDDIFSQRSFLNLYQSSMFSSGCCLGPGPPSSAPGGRPSPPRPPPPDRHPPPQASWVFSFGTGVLPRGPPADPDLARVRETEEFEDLMGRFDESPFNTDAINALKGVARRRRKE